MTCGLGRFCFPSTIMTHPPGHLPSESVCTLCLPRPLLLLPLVLFFFLHFPFFFLSFSLITFLSLMFDVVNLNSIFLLSFPIFTLQAIKPSSPLAGWSHSSPCEQRVACSVASTSVISVMSETVTVAICGSSGRSTQQSAVGAAQDLNSMQLFLPHLSLKS